MRMTPRSGTKRAHVHTWRKFWLCSCLDVKHLAPRECRNGWHAFVCEICSEPGYAIPADMAEVFE